MSAASVQPRIPSFPATPAKKKNKKHKGRGGGSFAPCGMCWGVQSCPAAVPGSTDGAPGAFAEAQGQQRGAGARSRQGELPGGFLFAASPGEETWHRPPPAPGILLPSPAQHRRSCSGIWEPHQSSARGRGCPWLPSRCRGCRAGLGSAAARLWAIPCALETGRESRDWEKSLQTPQQGEDPQRSPWKELPGCWRAAQPLLSLLPHGIPWGTIPAVLLDGQHLQEIRLALTGCLVLQPLPLEALKNK